MKFTPPYLKPLSLCLVLLASCSEAQSFKGATDSKDLPAETDADATAKVESKQEAPVVIPPVTQPAEPESTKEIVAIAKEEILAKVCTEKLAYDPAEILCSLQEDTSNTVWKHGVTWGTAWLTNKKASWISPLKNLQRDGQDYCPFVPQSEKAIYVSNFTLTEDQEVSYEAIMDDIGQVRIWKNADPSQQLVISPKKATAKGKVLLKKGFYSVVIDAIDTGAFASGAIASFFDAKGAVIRNTNASKDWCIFRVAVATDIPSFLTDSSSCRSCLIGDEAAKAVNP